MLDGSAVVIDVVPRSLEVRADPQLLDQVLLNLVRNAVDAMSARPQPQLRLDGRLAAGRDIIGVTDNGNGIDEHARDQIFVPFFTTKRDGSGIGLSLSRQIMTAHGGDISVQTGADGTTIRLAF
jgi:C4-dicarboxylate-specific signal transduction histidine kinase